MVKKIWATEISKLLWNIGKQQCWVKQIQFSNFNYCQINTWEVLRCFEQKSVATAILNRSIPKEIKLSTPKIQGISSTGIYICGITIFSVWNHKEVCTWSGISPFMGNRSSHWLFFKRWPSMAFNDISIKSNNVICFCLRKLMRWETCNYLLDYFPHELETQFLMNSRIESIMEKFALHVPLPYTNIHSTMNLIFHYPKLLRKSTIVYYST